MSVSPIRPDQLSDEAVRNLKKRMESMDDGGDGGGGMEARLAKVEAAVEHIENDIKDIKLDLREMRADAKLDFRLQFGALIVVALGLATIIAKGFKWF